jgi:transcriptional regulator with XRE-family HTH domain
MKKLFINKEKRVHSELFDKVRLARGLSRFKIAVELNMSAQTIRRALTFGGDPRPTTVKRIGEFLGIPPDDWYVPREDVTDETE